MKNIFIHLFVLALIVMIGCQPPANVSEKAEEPNYAAFDEKVSTARAFLQAHCDEDLEKMSSMIADTMLWSPPQYNGNKWLSKEEYMAALKGYHDNFENITYTEGIAIADTLANGMWSGSIFPKGTASNDPTAIRQYGTWTATHSATGKEIGVKWFGLSFINDEGMLVRVSEYWDLGGLLAQIAEVEPEQ